jgi:hypothetical protein
MEEDVLAILISLSSPLPSWSVIRSSVYARRDKSEASRLVELDDDTWLDFFWMVIDILCVELGGDASAFGIDLSQGMGFP